MEIFQELPTEKRLYMDYLFQNCTEEVQFYMALAEVEADRTLIEAGEPCTSIYMILSGKVTGIEWPMEGKAYSFKDFGPGDFFGEIECFADLASYRISVVTVTPCRVLIIPAVYYMEWLQKDVTALYLRTKENMHRLITQTAEARKYLFIESRERLMMYLIRKYEQKQLSGKELEIRQNRNQISEEIGFSVKTLNRSIKKLEEMQLIQMRKGKILMSGENYMRMKMHMEQYRKEEKKNTGRKSKSKR